jgi:hypothetical protein
MEPIEVFEREADKFLESLNGKSGNEIVALLPRIRRVVEKLNASLPILFGDEEN